MDEPERPRLSLWVLLAVLAGFTLAGEWLLFLAGLGGYALVVPILAAVVGLAYLVSAAPAARPSATVDDEPFEDPVEEALRETPPGPTPGPEGPNSEAGPGETPSAATPSPAERPDPE